MSAVKGAGCGYVKVKLPAAHSLAFMPTGNPVPFMNFSTCCQQMFALYTYFVYLYVWTQVKMFLKRLQVDKGCKALPLNTHRVDLSVSG